MSARANAPVFQLHPSATSNSSPSQIAAIPAPVPAHASHGFTPANAVQLMPNPPPVLAQHHQAPPPPSQQGPAHSFHQRTDSGSSQGRRRNDSFSRRRANTFSRSSVPPQLSHPLPQIHPASAEDLVSGARTAPAPIMQSSIKKEGSYIELYQKRRWEDSASGADLDTRSHGGRSPDRLSQRSATGSIKSFKRESGEFERPAVTALPSPPVPVAL